MGSSDKGTGVVDCGVGTIVWVRRRNGSWWPGKILGPEELSAAHLMSPRSGTPVKLLGREDASVDWYNLEKSKRVKAFRCGEFDDCIERAESSQGMPPKKREKYARREDAILHALELEKQLLEKKYGKLGCSSNYKSSKSSDAEEKELVASSECLGYGNSKHVQPKLHSGKVDLPLEDTSMDHPFHAQKVKEGRQLVGDEDNAEVIPRMRGLQDFGLRIAPSKRKLSSSIALNGFRKPEFDNNIHALSSGGISTENTIHAKSKISFDRRKRSYEMLTDESLVRRCDSRRPLVQVLRTSAMLSVHHPLRHDNDISPILVAGEEQTGVIRHANRSKFVELPGEYSDCSDDKQVCPNQMVISPSQIEESNHPASAVLGDQTTFESTETDSSSETGSLDSDADEEKAELSDVALVTELEPKPLERSGAQVQHGSISNEQPDDLALVNDLAHICPQDPVSASMGVSKWQLKRKRNNRGLAKRSISVSERMVLRGSAYGKNHGETESNGCDEAGLTEKNFTARMGAFDNRGYLLTSKSTTKASDDICKNIIDWEDLAWNDQSVLKGYWKDSSNYFDPVFVGCHNFGGRMKSMWVDVDLKVQSSYQREHVPMISLMSKLNGKAIVGHPIHIEALEDGSSEILLSASDGICLETLDNDTTLSPMWRTARRTANFRVPRPHPPATLDGEETADHFQLVDQDKKIPFKKSQVRSFGHKASVMRKTLSHASRPPLDRKFSRKPPKKISSSSSQKIKTLSSIGAQQKLSGGLKCGTINYQVDGLIKGESGPTAVACIPVKLVFSRLYEELVGRHQ